MRGLAEKIVTPVIRSLKNVLEGAHRNYGVLSAETAETVAAKQMAWRMNSHDGFGTIVSAKLFMLSTRDLLLQLGRWEVAGKVVWKAPSGTGCFSGEDISFMEKLPFSTMFVEGPMHVFGREAAGFFISGNPEKRRSMISFVFMDGDKLAYSRSIEIRYDRPRSRSINVRFPRAEATADGLMWKYPSVGISDVEEYEIHAVRAEQTALGVLEAICMENSRSARRPKSVAATPQSRRTASGSGVSGVPDFRFFGVTGSGKGNHAGTRTGHGKGTPKAPHPVSAFDSHRWHRVPGDDMANVPDGVQTRWRPLKSGKKALYMSLPSRVREFHTGKDRKEVNKKTPIRIRVGK